MSDPSTRKESPSGRVSGVVRFWDGVPAEGYLVKAFARSLDEDRTLGSAKITAAGTFEIEWPPARARKSRPAALDLVVKVLDDDNRELTSSGLFPAAHLPLTVHLQIDRKARLTSDFDDLLAAVATRLDGKSPADLTPANIDYLATVTGADARKIALLARSARCRAALAGSPAGELPASAYYAWLGQGLPEDATALLAQPQAKLVQALEHAQATGVVNEPAHEVLVSLRQAHARLTAESTTSAAPESGSLAWPDLAMALVHQDRVACELAPAAVGGRLTVANLFGEAAKGGRSAEATAAPLSDAHRRVLAELTAGGGRKAKALDSLQDHGFQPAQRALVQRRLALATLAEESLPLVNALDRSRPADADPEDGSLAYLAALDPAQWRTVVETAGASDGRPEEQREDCVAATASALEQRVEAAYRTRVLASRLAQGAFSFPGARRQDLLDFFDRNPDFEFGRQRVAAVLRKTPDAGVAGVADRKALLRDLLKLERTFKLAQDHHQQSALLARGFASAHDVVGLGKRDFVRRVGGDPKVGGQAAEVMFARAEHVAATAVHMAMTYRATGSDPAVIPRAPLRPEAVDDADVTDASIPDLETLFGSLDDTLGDPCLSVLSPPAYFVDLLQFLDKRQLPHITITSPTKDSLLSIDADRDTLSLLVDANAESGGVDGAVIWISTADQDYKFAWQQQTSTSISLGLGKQRIQARLWSSDHPGAALLAQDIVDVEVAHAAAAGTLTKVLPTAITIDEDVTNYPINVTGTFVVSGTSSYAVTVTPNIGPAVDAQIQDGIFSATITNDAAGEARFAVTLISRLAGVEGTLDRKDITLTVSRNPVTGTVTIAGPVGTVSQPSDEVNFMVTGTFTFNGTDDHASLAVKVTATMLVEGDVWEIDDKPANLTFASTGRTGSFRYPIDFVQSAPLLMKYTVNLAAVLSHTASDPPNIASTQASFFYQAQKSRTSPDVLDAAYAGRDEPDVLPGRVPAAAPLADFSGAATVLDVLRERRPDLIDIELSCANADIELPYVDLTLEILEAAVAAQLPLDLGIPASDVDAVLAALNAGSLPAVMASELSDRLGLNLTGEALVDVITADGRWQVADDGVRLSLTAIEGEFTLQWVVPQTSEQTDQISAQPEHFNATAYAVLAQAGYPWSLPLDLPSEQARRCLSQLGLSRGDLIETFYTAVSDPLPEFGPFTDGWYEAAAERLGITSSELSIISGSRSGTGKDSDPNSGPWNFWGFSAASLSPGNSIPNPSDATARIESGRWAGVLAGRVDVLLQQSGLSFDDLRQLLDMRYVNTHDDGQMIVRIQLADVPLDTGDNRTTPSSDLSLATLTKPEHAVAAGMRADTGVGARLWRADGFVVRPLVTRSQRMSPSHAPAVDAERQAAPADDAADDPDIVGVLTRMHRFVRLWRHMGWDMRDVDQCLAFVPRWWNERWPDLDKYLVSYFDQFQRFSRDRFHRTEKFLGLYGNVPYRDFSVAGEPVIRSLYERVFLDKSVADPPPAEFELDAARDEISDPTQDAADSLPHIAAACGLSLQDATLVLDWLGTSPKLTLDNLSTFFWAGLLTATAPLSVQQLLDLVALTSPNGLSTLWDDPADAVDTPVPVEVGLKFLTYSVGQIVTLRFWKAPGETGPHTARLWDAGGRLLGTAEFRSESASGWQEAALAAPVMIDANSVHVVSVTVNHRYAQTLHGITAEQQGYLQAPPGDAANGLTGAAGSFPTDSADSPNHYCDVGFIPNGLSEMRSLLPEAVTSAGFSVDEVLYLLASKQSAGDALSEADSVRVLLGQLRAALAAVVAELSLPSASTDEQAVSVLRRELLALGWAASVVDEAVATIRTMHSAALALLPPGVDLPDPALPGVDWADNALTSVMTLDDAALSHLAGLSNAPDFQAAVAELASQFAAARATVARDLSGLQPRDMSTPLAALPADLGIPPDLAKRLYFDATTKTLHFIGSMDDATLAQIGGLTQHQDFLGAVASLRAQYLPLPAGTPVLLTDAQQHELLSGIASTADRCSYLLAALVPNRQALVACDRLQPLLGLQPATIHTLLALWLSSAGSSRDASCLSDFLDPAFTQSSPAIPATADAFPAPFRSCVRLRKLGLLVSRFRLTPTSLAWLFGPSSGKDGWLNVNQLPAAADEPALALNPLLRAAGLFRLRDQLPDGETSLAAVFAAAQDASTTRSGLLQAVAGATGWNVDDLSVLVGADGFDFTADDQLRAALLRDALLSRLRACFALMHRLGATATQCLGWSAPQIGADAAADIRRVVKGRHTDSAWAALAPSLQDGLREQQRAALVSWLIGSQQLRDSTDLYDRYLIDPEMQPATMTSRIKQACASVQLFVQRCLLNLEPDVPPEVIPMEIWRWMKNFRVWEANRRIFLYPENWLQPELRDDKSEFYRQLESDLLQGDVTHELGLSALTAYIEKLGDISRISIAALHDEGDVNGVRIVHVLGRDGSSPYRYLYRQWRIPSGADAGYWTAWEELSAGIDSDHVLIFKFAGTIHVAWPTIKSSGASEPVSISMNVVKRRQAGWTARKNGDGSLSWLPPPNIDASRGLAFRISEPAPGQLRVDGYGAPLDERVFTQTRPIAFALSQEQYAGTQNGTFGLRNLVRLTDGNDRTYYSVATDTSVSVSAWATNLLFSGPSNAGELTTSADLKDLFKFPIDEYFELTHFLTIAQGDLRYKPLTYSQTYELTNGKGTYAAGLTLTGDVVLELAQAPQPGSNYAALLSPERAISVDMHLGYFGLDIRGTFTAMPGAGDLPIETPSTVDTVPFRSNGLEKVGRGNRDLFMTADGGSALLNRPETTPPLGRFYTTELPHLDGQLSFAVAYSDTDRDLVFRTNDAVENSPVVTPPYAVVPASSTWTNDLLEWVETGDVESAMALQQEGAIAAVPINIGAAIDARTSITSIDISFDSRLPWAIYNWETFFHIPVGVAVQLSRNNRYADAQRWLALVFDPTFGRTGRPGEQFWRFQPFAKAGAGESIESQLLQLAAGNPALIDQITAWQENPFDPHLLARMRIRPYQVFVVLRYIDNLIAWGDDLFRRDTIESINEATQLYVLASEILGRRPRQIQTQTGSRVKTYRLLRDSIDDFSNALVQLESLIPTSLATRGRSTTAASPGNVFSLYFGIPANDAMTSCWDTVADRLSKIRTSRNFEGVARTLALYEPPIDPALLVRAAAAGISIDSVLADVQGSMPIYRFSTFAAKALDVANDVRSFGANLLSAIEKQDSELLARLRSTEEVALLSLVATVKDQQLSEAKAAVAALRKGRETVAQRYLQYQQLLGKGTIAVPVEGASASLESTPTKASPSTSAPAGDAASLALSQSEDDHLAWMNVGNNFSIISSTNKQLAGIFHALPQVVTTPLGVGIEWGGTNLGNVGSAVGDFFQLLAANASYQGGRSATISGHQRRFDDWAFQSNLAAKELEQIDSQIIAGDLRVAIAKQEVVNHQRQMTNAAEVDDFMRNKFSNAELYRWMRDQSATMHFIGYQLAYDLARSAEQAYRFELGLEAGDTSFVRFGQWDGLRSGLSAGEMLALDVKRMEIAFLRENRREFEITKSVSLRQLDAGALLELRAGGSCTFELPEALFDLDFAGHYFRRIKSVSVSLPCVVGPYTSVNGTLTLQSSRLRGSPVVKKSYDDPSNYRVSYRPLQAIATSTAQNDGGLFELNFRDERYLPFEGCGALSTWSFRLPEEFRSFDYLTISDLVIHVRYMARSGGDLLAKASTGTLVARLNALTQGQDAEGGMLELCEVRQDFAAQWRTATTSNADVDLHLFDELFPYMFRMRIQVIAAAFHWTVQDDKGRTSLQSAAVMPTVPDGGGLPVITLPQSVTKASSDPWLVVRYRVST